MATLSAVSKLAGKAKLVSQIRAMSSAVKNYETLAVSVPQEFVYHVSLNRPEQLNAMNRVFWKEISECFRAIAADEDCRAVVLSGNGKHFTAGLDLMDMGNIVSTIMDDKDIARKFRTLQGVIAHYQESFTAIEECPKPVIAAVHSACIGGGVDLITAADIRYCTDDAYFQVKEVDLGLAADVGTLQRLPKVVGSQSLVRELCLTARKMYSVEALQAGLVSRTFQTKDSMMEAAVETAALIAAKSPVAVQGTKHNLNYSRDHSVKEGLEYMVTWNAAMLQSEDMRVAAMALMNKKGPPPKFSKL